MPRSVYCFILFSPLLFTQAQDLKSATRILQSLAEQMRDKLQYLQNQTSCVDHLFKLESKGAEGKAEDMLNEALRQVGNLPCKPAILDQVRLLAEKSKSRFEDCVNFTRSIADIQQLILESVALLDHTELEFCSVMRNVTLCPGNIFEKSQCVIETVLRFGMEYRDLLLRLKDLLVSAKRLADKITQEFHDCFHWRREHFTEAVRQLIKNNC